MPQVPATDLLPYLRGQFPKSQVGTKDNTISVTTDGAGLLTPDAGDVRFEDGLQDGLRRRCSYLFQGNALFDSLTALDKARVLRHVDRDLASDRVRLPLRHIPLPIRLACRRLVRAINCPLKRLGECGRLARLDAFKHNLVALHDLIDVDAQMPHGGVAGQPGGQATG